MAVVLAAKGFVCREVMVAVAEMVLEGVGGALLARQLALVLSLSPKHNREGVHLSTCDQGCVACYFPRAAAQKRRGQQRHADKNIPSAHQLKQRLHEDFLRRSTTVAKATLRLLPTHQLENLTTGLVLKPP